MTAESEVRGQRSEIGDQKREPWSPSAPPEAGKPQRSEVRDQKTKALAIFIFFVLFAA
jgi:hypothetical protein